jgi:hypothetical protein
MASSAAIITARELAALSGHTKRAWQRCMSGYDFWFLADTSELDGGAIQLVSPDMSNTRLQWVAHGDQDVLVCACTQWASTQCCEHVAHIMKCCAFRPTDSYYKMLCEHGLAYASGILRAQIRSRRDLLRERKGEKCPICLGVGATTAHVQCPGCLSYYCSGCIRAWHGVSGCTKCPMCKRPFSY